MGRFDPSPARSPIGASRPLAPREPVPVTPSRDPSKPRTTPPPHGPSPIHRSSFSFIRELCGEYSELFYALQRRLLEARSAEELTRVGLALEDAREGLRDVELRKLRLVLSRRWKAL